MLTKLDNKPMVRRTLAGSKRHGAILVGVLACLMIGTVLIGLSLQTALRGRREARLERQLAQTHWLCEGGLIRAVAALRKSPDYRGETWRPELNLEPFNDAAVEINVERVADAAATTPADVWTVRIVARLDSTTDSDGPMQRSLDLNLTLVQASESNLKPEKSE